MSGLLRLVASTLVVLLATAATLASPSAVDSRGIVHTVESVVWTDGPRVGGTALRYLVQDPDGEVRSEIIPGTDDLSIDREPSLALDPVTERPVLVWSRSEGADYDLMLTSVQDDTWNTPVRIASGPGDQAEPQLTIRRELVHIVWTTRAGAAGDVPYRLSLWRSSLEPAFGPEKLPGRSPATISADGGFDPESEASTADLTYFASAIQDPESGDETIVVWGIRDEPLPITYVQAFEIHQGIQDPRDATAGWHGGSLVTSFVAGGGLHYSVREDGVWTDLRVITLDHDIDAGGALELVEEMIRRNVEGAPPD